MTNDTSMQDNNEQDAEQNTQPAKGAHGARKDPVKDAVKYRRQLRETERERDEVSERYEKALARLHLQTIQGIQVDHKTLRHASDLQLFTGRGAKDYLNEEGELDTERLQQDLTQLYEDRPELFEHVMRTPEPDPSQGHGRGDPFGWDDAFLM